MPILLRRGQGGVSVCGASDQNIDIRDVEQHADSSFMASFRCHLDSAIYLVVESIDIDGACGEQEFDDGGVAEFNPWQA